jgi:hypothetical protein
MQRCAPLVPTQVCNELRRLYRPLDVPPSTTRMGWMPGVEPEPSGPQPDVHHRYTTPTVPAPGIEPGPSSV